MPQDCSICKSVHRGSIEKALPTAPLRAIARQYGTSKDAIRRHKKHISAVLLRSEKARELASAHSLIAIVQGLIAELEEVKAQARQRRDNGPEVRKTVETILKGVQVLADLSGARAPRVTVNIDVPSREEGIQTAAELLLELASRAEVLQLIEQLQQRLLELPPVIDASEPLRAVENCKSGGVR
jgi:hypothetical protein